MRPTQRNAGGGTPAASQSRSQSRDSSQDRVGEQAKPFVVEIIVFQKMRIWGRYKTISAAQQDANKLRAHQFDALVRRAS